MTHLDEIRARDGQPILGLPMARLIDQAILDRRALLAEVDRLQAAVDAVREINTGNNRELYGNDFEAGMAKALWLVNQALGEDDDKVRIEG